MCGTYLNVSITILGPKINWIELPLEYDFEEGYHEVEHYPDVDHLDGRGLWEGVEHAGEDGHHAQHQSHVDCHARVKVNVL